MNQVLRDSLTGLPNLIAMADQIRQVPTDGSALALMDLDRLQTINQDLGYGVGDRVITVFAETLRDLLAQIGPGGQAYRTGGDEFVLSLVEPAAGRTEEALSDLASLFEARLQEERLPPVTFRYAVARHPRDGGTLAELLSRVHSRLPSSSLAGTRSATRWVEGLLGWFVTRLAETVDALRETREMALTDTVSGMPNHRAAQECLDRLLSSYRSDGTRFALLFVDGDNLKAYNEMLGYEAGNQMIRDLGHTLAAHLRTDDYVSRWLSGDEFLVVLPGTGGPTACAVAQRLRQAVERQSRSWPLPVTVSVGVAVCPEDGATEPQLLSAASEANAVAKSLGKNRVYWPGEPGLA